MRLTVEELIEAADRLAVEDRRRLVRSLVEKTAEGERRIVELRGLGKEVWGGQDAQQYVDQERESWAG